MRLPSIALLGLLGSMAVAPVSAETGDRWLVYEGIGGPGDGVRIVLISGDEEYRSEEALPQLAAILAFRHGFHCTVLFAIDPETGIINPNEQTNIPGLETLGTADLVLVFTRLRSLPDDQMKWIDEYLLSGRPVIGLRTATHAFRPPDATATPRGRTRRGAGRLHAAGAGDRGRAVGTVRALRRRILRAADGVGGRLRPSRAGRERWIAHHGRHKHESTRGIAAPGAAGHPILRGVAPGSIWGPTDVYRVRLPLPGDARPLVLGQVVERRGDFDEQDPFFGMRPDDGPPAAAKNDPMMPVAWTKTYRVPGGKPGRVFATTLGASTDLLSAGLRRLIVNAVYWSLGKAEEIPGGGAAVDLVGRYEPTQYGFLSTEHHQSTGRRPADLRVEPGRKYEE